MRNTRNLQLGEVMPRLLKQAKQQTERLIQPLFCYFGKHKWHTPRWRLWRGKLSTVRQTRLPPLPKSGIAGCKSNRRGFLGLRQGSFEKPESRLEKLGDIPGLM